jgi:hypothetical protein
MMGICTWKCQIAVQRRIWRGTNHPEEEKTQQISGSDASTRWKAIRDVVVPIAEDSSHEHRGDTTTIVCLRREVDNGDHSSDKDVQARSSNTRCGADVDREADEVFDSASAVQHDQDSQDSRSNDGCNHTVPP